MKYNMKDQKIIVNIGRQIGSGGRIIARQLAEVLNCAFYDRELLNLAAKESGFSEKFFEQNDEKKGFLHTPFHVNIPLMGENNFYKNDFSLRARNGLGNRVYRAWGGFYGSASKTAFGELLKSNRKGRCANTHFSDG